MKKFKEMQKPKLIDLKYSGDARGFFCEVWRDKELANLTEITEWAQVNWSRSSQGVLRGLHFQRPPHAQAKAVWVTRGKVFDVCLDIRGNSPDFGKTYIFELCGDNPQMLYVPQGFAHGFCTVSESVDFMYRCSGLYEPSAEGGVLWNDPQLEIHWPSLKYTLSKRDEKWPSFNAQLEELKGLTWNT
ncbi:MAG: dTDP-4-dehydrorhamnose 3,5-epimerase [Bdellovibrionota bacterium]